jgi:four helix bundle protein
MPDHRQLRAWREGLDLVEAVYRATAEFPVEERFGLATQMRRSAVSVPANLAEGCGRQTQRELARYVWISFASLVELETHIIIGERIGLLADPELEERVQRLKAMLLRFAGKIESRQAQD